MLVVKEFFIRFIKLETGIEARKKIVLKQMLNISIFPLLYVFGCVLIYRIWLFLP
jgi:hypothetical protein